jgi:hypothetical protein
MTILFDQQLEHGLSEFRLQLEQESWQESNLQPGRILQRHCHIPTSSVPGYQAILKCLE